MFASGQRTTAAAAQTAEAAAAAAEAIKSVLASGGCSSAADPNNGVTPLSAEGAHLMLAVQRSDRATVNRLLRSAGVASSFFIADAKGPEFRTPLRLAAAVASTDIIEDLISYGAAAAEFVELDGWTAFHCAAAAGRERVFLLLLDLCPEEAAAAAAGSSLLHLLAECCGSSKATEAALKAAALRQQVDAKAKRQGFEGWTPLHISCLRGKQRMARILLQAGADASIVTGAFDASSPFLKAAATGAVCSMLRIDTSALLEQSKTNAQPVLQLQEPEQQEDSLIPPSGKDSGLLPIHLSCFGAHRGLTRLLLHVGSRIDALTGRLRWTPLHFATASGSVALVGDICRWSAGKLVNMKDEGRPLQRTPLIIACARQDLETVKVLLAFGANPLKSVRFAGMRAACLGELAAQAEEQEEQVTPLHIAVLGGCPEFVVSILQVFKHHVERFGTNDFQKGTAKDVREHKRQIFSARDAAALQTIITGGCGQPPVEVLDMLEGARRQAGKVRAPSTVLLAGTEDGAKGGRWSSAALAVALATSAACSGDTIGRRRIICAALIGFAAAEAPAEIAAEACGLERLLAVTDEPLALRIIEELSQICLYHPESQRVEEGKTQHLRVHGASVEQLRDLFSVISSRFLQHAVLRNFSGVVRRLLQLGVYEQNAAEKALHIAASLGYARICQLLVDAGIEAVSGPSTDKGPFELLAKALQQQQKHSLLQQQHDILEAAAAAASITPLAAGTSGTTKRAAVAALEAAASSTLKHSPQQRRETTYNSNLGLSPGTEKKRCSTLKPPPIVCSLEGEANMRREKGRTVKLKPFKLNPKHQTLNIKDY